MNVLVALCVSLLGRAVLCGNLRNDDSSSQPACLESTSVETSLDLASPDPSLCHPIETCIDGVLSKVFIMEPSATVCSVMNGDDSIWVSTSSTCSYCIAFLGGGGPKMAYILSKTGAGEFRKWNNGWELVPENSCDANLNNLRTHKAALTKFSLDLSTTNNTNCNVTREDRDGLSTHIYATKPGHSIMAIMDNGKEVWSVPNDHTCFLCELHADDKSKLLRLHVKSGNYQFTFHTFESSGDEWNGVEESVFARKLKEMRKTSLAEKVTLDLGSIDGTLFTLINYHVEGITTRHITPKDGYRLTEVSDGQTTIWESEGDNPFCLSTRTHYDDGSPILTNLAFIQSDKTVAYRFYSKRGGKWTQVTKDVHDAALASMRRNVILAKPEAKLNVAEVDGTMFTIRDSTEGDVPTKTFTPKSGHRLTEVSDGPNIIWKGEDGYAKSAWFHYDTGGSPILATVQFVKGDGTTEFVYYVRQNGGHWEWVEKNVHDERLTRMKRDIILAKQNVKLDVSSMEGVVGLTIVESKGGGIPVKTVTPKGGYRLMEVFYDQERLWKGEDETEHCICVMVYYNVEGKLLSVSLNIVKSDGLTPWRFYHKRDGGWTLDGGNYEASLKNDPTRQLSSITGPTIQAT